MMEWITTNGMGLIEIATQIVGVFAIIAVWTPNKADNKIASALLELINFVGGNLGRARNAPDA